MFAVIRTGGKQYKVAKDDVIHVERLPGEAGAQILFDQVLLVGEGANATAGVPLVSGATVAGTLLEQVLAEAKAEDDTIEEELARILSNSEAVSGATTG